MDFENFYKEHYRIVYGYLLSLCRDPALAEDLAAETFLRALQSIEKYDPRRKASTWLCTIAKNLYFDEAARQKRHRPMTADIPQLAAELENRYIRKEQAAAILTCADALDDPYRTVFFMRLKGLSFREIGNALEKTENWARVTYFRAKNRILEALEG